MQYLSLLVPIAYLGILLTSLATFSSLYRARKVRKSQSLAPYFPPHIQRNIYLSLLHLPDSDSNAAKVPESVIRAALLNRAVEDIRRLIEIKQRKPALQQLLAKGVVGDEIWQRMLRAEQEMEIECRDVVNEAQALSGGTWGQTIFQSANEMYNNQLLRKRLDAIKATIPAEKAAWDAKREQSRRELEGETPVTSTPEPAAAVSEKTKTGSSDEDSVMVEPPLDVSSAAGGSGARNRKRKGKK